MTLQIISTKTRIKTLNDDINILDFRSSDYIH